MIRSPHAYLWLFAAVLLPLAAVGAWGLYELVSDAGRVRARYAERATTLAEALAEDMLRAAMEVHLHPHAVAWQASIDGQLVVINGVPHTPELRAGYDNVLLDLRAALEREATANPERVISAMTQEQRPELLAWWLSSSAAKAHQAGDDAKARALWQRLVTEHPTVRDERGLLYAHAAASELAALDGDQVDVLQELYQQLWRDRQSLADTASGALALQVHERLARRDPEAAKAALQATTSHVRTLEWLASWPLGVSNWVAQGATDGLMTSALTSDPLVYAQPDKWIVQATQTGASVNGYALPLSLLVTELQTSPRLSTADDVHFTMHWMDLKAEVSSPSEYESVAPTGRARCAPPLSDYAVQVFGLDFPEYEARAQRRVYLTAALGCLAFVVAAGAAAATVRALNKEQASAKAREQFVAAVTHELKTPLASIRLLAELLQQGDIPPLQVQQFGSRTVREADRLARLVDSILRYAQLEHGVVVAPVPLVMADLLEAARESVAPVIEERGHTLRVHNLAPTIRVQGERDALVSVVAELLDNASKYGAAESGIDVTLRSEAARMRLEVSDRGPGIATEDRERVFLPFHRLGNELVREQKGVGLGLALVQGIIVAHRGQVGCIAREGGGTTFWLELPAVPDSPDTTP